MPLEFLALLTARDTRIPHETQANRGENQALPLRPDAHPMEAAQATAPRGQARRAAPLRRPPRGPQRHLLHHPRRPRPAGGGRRAARPRPPPPPPPPRGPPRHLPPPPRRLPRADDARRPAPLEHLL